MKKLMNEVYGLRGKHLMLLTILFGLMSYILLWSVRFEYTLYQELLDNQKTAEDLLLLMEEKNQLIENQKLFISELLKEKEQWIKQSHNVTEKEAKYSFTDQELYLLAQCVQAEAGYHDKAQQYITQVILNHLDDKKFPNTIREVIYKKNGNIPHFSVAYNGHLQKQKPTEQTFKNVRKVVYGEPILPPDVLVFYSDYVKGNWVNTLPVYETFDGFVFAQVK